LKANSVGTTSEILPHASKNVRRKKKGPNGFIPPSIRVSAALRYFAGGSPYDIALTNGISHSAVFVSVWAVVDAVNAHPKLQIDYPRCHTKQRKIAEGFFGRL
jgi:hypothetical protein